MKDESIASLLESGEIQMTEDVVFMCDLVLMLFNRAAETDRDQFIGMALQVLEAWKESLEANDGRLEASDQVLNIVMGRP